MAARARARYELTAEDKSGKAFRSFRESLSGTTREVASFVSHAAAIGGTAVLGGLAALTRRAINTGDQIGKLSTRLGASTEFLSEMQHVTRQAGVSFQQFGTGIQRMTRRIAEGTDKTRQSIEDLGLDFDRLRTLGVEDQFLTIAEALNRIPDASERVRLAFSLFDTEGVGLLQTMNEGAEGIERMREEARELGTSLSGEQVAAMEKYRDAVGRLDTAMLGLGTSIATSILPTLTDFVELLPKIPGSVKSLLIGDTSGALSGLGATVTPGLLARERGGPFGRGPGFDTAAVDALLAGGRQADPNRVQKVEDEGVARTNELMETLIDETRALTGAFVLE